MVLKRASWQTCVPHNGMISVAVLDVTETPEDEFNNSVKLMVWSL